MIALESECDEAGRLALAATPAPLREGLAAALALDARLMRIAVDAREPMLAQLRLAWWRDRLGDDVDTRPKGDPVLDAIGSAWRGDEAALIALVNGWEELLGDSAVESKREAVGQGRAAVFAAFARRAGHAAEADAASVCAHSWAAATVLRLSGEVPAQNLTLPRLPRPLRGLALLGGLARRAVHRGDGALLGDRMSPLAALRLSLIGR